jgi:hypothetical protein
MLPLLQIQPPSLPLSYPASHPVVTSLRHNHRSSQYHDPHRIALADRGRPGSPSKLVDRIATTTPYTADMLATENEYHARGMIAVMVCEDPWLHLTREEVQEAAGNCCRSRAMTWASSSSHPAVSCFSCPIRPCATESWPATAG